MGIVELRHLRYFVAVAEELSFTAAANRLHVSQPPLSLQIRDLEQELKTQLFARTSRRVELTPAGKAFFEHARAILSQTEQAAHQARAIGSGQIGTLDIGTTGSVLLGPLAPLIGAFNAEMPDVIVRIHEMPPEEQQAALHARRMDISFLRRPAEDPDLDTELAWREKVGVVLPGQHRLSARKRIALSDLREEPIVFLRQRDSRFAQYLRDCCLDAGFTPRISQEVVESHSLVSLVVAGLGVALVPECVKNLARSGVVYRPLAEPAPIADVRILYRPDRSAVVQRFLDFGRAFLKAA